jgi:hypothetical protein
MVFVDFETLVVLKPAVLPPGALTPGSLSSPS